MSDPEPNQPSSPSTFAPLGPLQEASESLSLPVLAMFALCLLVGVLCGKYLLSDYEGENARFWYEQSTESVKKLEEANAAFVKQVQAQSQLDSCLAVAEKNHWDYLVLNGEVVKAEDGSESVRAQQRFFDEANSERERARDLCFRRYK